jgi:hypothetical protein
MAVEGRETSQISSGSAPAPRSAERDRRLSCSQRKRPGLIPTCEHLKTGQRDHRQRIVEARKCGELPPAEEERPLTPFEQRRLEILKQAACMLNFPRIDARKCEKMQPTDPRTTTDISPYRASFDSSRRDVIGPAAATP